MKFLVSIGLMILLARPLWAKMMEVFYLVIAGELSKDAMTQPWQKEFFVAEIKKLWIAKRGFLGEVSKHQTKTNLIQK